MKITIAGAGIGGLAAAIALRRKGHQVRVCEQASEISEVGAGIQISPNGMAVLRALEVDQDLDDVSVRATAVRLIDGPTGKPVLTLDLARHAPDLDWRFVHRARLIELLAARATSLRAALETGVTVEPPLDGSAMPGDDLLIGADGLHSRLRAKVDEASKPFFTGQVAWRTVIPGTGAPVVEVHMGPGRHLVSYPLAGNLRNIVAVEERSAWAEEGWSHEDHPANLRAAFTGFSPRVQAWLHDIESCFLWGLFRHRVADRWHAGAQVLVGDAAHPTLPFLAQGANLALEDAFVLSEALSGAELPDALTNYQSLRQARAAQIIEAATKNARNYHLRHPLIRKSAHGILRMVGRIAPAQPLKKFDWLYRHDVTAKH
ncbi:MAG: NAD(P)-binding protein [Boseongicola sp.]|nr:MAG: NAD(P)-binding protein [Boseongicola sp.]